ncbi:MAG: nucleotide exchange factor GrpE [Solirubrobacterales bacterium]
MPSIDSAQPAPEPEPDLTPSGSVEGPAVSSKVDQSADESAQVESDLDALLADTKRERDEYLELAQRTKADFENYRKRMAAEVQAAALRGKAELAVGMIGVLDNLERALGVAGIEPDSEKAPAEPLAEGFFLTYRELLAALQRAGIESFDPSGKRFDPSWHEAQQKVPVDGTEAGVVVEVMQKGYRLGEQLIRPARVVVSE